MPAGRFFFFNITGEICWANLFGFGTYDVISIDQLASPALGLRDYGDSALNSRIAHRHVSEDGIN
jgi:hypothetical protein